MANLRHREDFNTYVWSQDLIDLLRSEGQIIDTVPEFTEHTEFSKSSEFYEFSKSSKFPEFSESSKYSEFSEFSESSKFSEFSESQEKVGEENGNHISREREINRIKIKVSDQEMVHTILLILLLLHYLLSFI